MSDKLPVVLTIAGSDSGGGAGIQADLKTFTALGTFGTTAITAITSQNLSGVRSIQGIEPRIVGDQIAAVCEGFVVAAVKTGMLFSSEIIHVVAESVRRFEIKQLVVDPVFAATSGAKLIQDEAIATLRSELFPLARVITPNLPEAEFLADMPIHDPGEMRIALGRLLSLAPQAVFVLKGGHLRASAVDLYAGGGTNGGELRAAMVEGINNHGSGCSFAAAIAALLAKGNTVENAIRKAKEFVTGALRAGLTVLPDVRLINHFWNFPVEKD